MRRLTLTLSTLLVCAFASAARAQLPLLREYVKRSLARCPDSSVTLNEIRDSGPANFTAYEVTLNSSEESCRTRKYLLHSPKTNQVIVGTVFLLPQDNRPVALRVNEHASQLLKREVRSTVSPFPLPDGVKHVAIVKQTPYGPFSYRGMVDASERFLIIGTRGNLRTDPAKTLRESLGLQNAMRRGNPKAKVEIIELSDFQCPTCARAHKRIEPIITKNLDKIQYLRLDLPLFESHPWAVPAAMGARAIQRVAPAKYWKYVDHLFENQEAIGKMSFDKFFKEYVEDHDIDWKAVEKIYRSNAERIALLEQVSRAFDNGISSTPTFIINGQVMGFGPDGKFVLEAIRRAVK